MSVRWSHLLGMDLEAVQWLIAEQFEGKKKLIAPNIQALGFGYDYARDSAGGCLCTERDAIR